MNTDGAENEQPTIPPSNQNSDLPTIAPGQNTNVPVSDAPIAEFGDYQVIEEIARGGMGVVYRAMQKSLNREVAVKMILAGQFASTEHVERFKTEAEAAAKLDHSAIVPIYEIDEFQGHHYFSMKLIDGGNYEDLLPKLRDSDLPTLIRILEEVTQAVHHAHQRGILHRDLKPANILVDTTGQPYVTDLGLARNLEGGNGSTQTGAIMGTPSYMSPEQAAGSADITTATDIYSLGAILYEVLTGRPPFQGASAIETVMQVVSEMPALPSTLGATNKELEAICMKCLAKEPMDRYSSASELASDLKRWLNGEPVSVRAQSVLSTTRFWMKQNFGRAAWALIIGPVFGVISGYCFWYATIQERVDLSLATFDKFSSIERPFTLISGIAIPILSIPLLMTFAFTIVFIGYVTAVFVKPKNRGADIAAGIVVGFFATLAAFVVCFGAMNVLTSSNLGDLHSISALSKLPAGETLAEVTERYPEFESIPRDAQISLLAEKVEAEYIYRVPQAIWVGLLMSIGFYFIPCVFEIWAAGPLLRKHKTWYFALIPYLEVAFPVVIAMTILGVLAATWFLFGVVGVLIGIRILMMAGLVLVAVYLRMKQWRWPVRLVLNLILAGFFFVFVVYDFRFIPSIVGFRAGIQRAEKLMEESKEKVAPELVLADRKVEYAKFLQTIWQGDRAITMVESAEADLRSRAEGLEGEDAKKLRDSIRRAKIERALILEKEGDAERAIEVVEELAEEFPYSPWVKGIRDRMNGKPVLETEGE